MILLEPAPFVPFADPASARLPGLSPVPEAGWITQYADMAEQLACRDRLVREQRSQVVQQLPEARAAVEELCQTVVAHLGSQPGWSLADASVRRPGGMEISRSGGLSLECLARLVSEDFCLLEQGPAAEEYRLTAAVLCFPAHWSLAEKLGQPLTAIHAPVPDYDTDLARRVNRVFAGVRAGQVLMRHNWGLSVSPELHAPPGAVGSRSPHRGSDPIYLRTERQTLRRLPRTGAVAFGIRTAMSPISGLSEAQARAFFDGLSGITSEVETYKGGPALFAAARAQLRRRAGC